MPRGATIDNGGGYLPLDLRRTREELGVRHLAARSRGGRSAGERYERRSLLVTSNVVFSQWDQIFHSPMATAAAIDRIVHHSVILEFDVPSYRTDAARSQRSVPSVEEPAKRASRTVSRKSASQDAL